AAEFACRLDVDRGALGGDPVPGIELVREVFEKTARPYLAGRARPAELRVPDRAARWFAGLTAAAPPECRPRLRELEELVRVRRWLWLLAALLLAAPLTAATVAAGLADSTPTPLAAVASRGPVANPHAAWESNCEVCHTPFTSIRPGHTADAKCQACHTPADHSANQKPASVAGCADCHRDHQGRTASLTRLADETCTGCHAS